MGGILGAVFPHVNIAICLIWKPVVVTAPMAWPANPANASVSGVFATTYIFEVMGPFNQPKVQCKTGDLSPFVADLD